MPSKVTTPIILRVHNEVLEVVQRRIKSKHSHWHTVGEYLRERLQYDILRTHHKKGDKK